MIMPLVTIALLLPLIIGILSVDINGDRFSIREWLATNNVNVTESQVRSQIDPTPEIDTELPPIFAFPQETEEIVNDFSTMVSEGVTFLLYQTRELGIWIGLSTAPYHYVIAILIGFAVFPTWWLFLGAVFYLAIKERKGISNAILTNKALNKYRKELK